MAGAIEKASTSPIATDIWILELLHIVRPFLRKEINSIFGIRAKFLSQIDPKRHNNSIILILIDGQQIKLRILNFVELGCCLHHCFK